MVTITVGFNQYIPTVSCSTGTGTVLLVHYINKARITIIIYRLIIAKQGF